MTDSANPQALPFVKAWESYLAVCQTLFERLNDRSTTANVSAPLPLAILGSWQDFAAKVGMPPDAAGKHFNPEDMFTRYLPALGYSREYQEIARRMFDLTVQFQQRCAAFAQQGVDIGQNALQAIQKRSSCDSTMLESPAAIYDAWIESAEEAYAQAAHSVEFARLLADICNTLSAFKIERGKLLEAFARHFDLPSRAEVDSLHRQVRNLTAAAAKTAACKTSEAVKTNKGTKTSARDKSKKRAGRAGRTARAGKATARKRARK